MGKIKHLSIKNWSKGKDFFLIFSYFFHSFFFRFFPFFFILFFSPCYFSLSILLLSRIEIAMHHTDECRLLSLKDRITIGLLADNPGHVTGGRRRVTNKQDGWKEWGNDYTKAE